MSEVFTLTYTGSDLPSAWDSIQHPTMNAARGHASNVIRHNDRNATVAVYFEDPVTSDRVYRSPSGYFGLDRRGNFQYVNLDNRQK